MNKQINRQTRAKFVTAPKRKEKKITNQVNSAKQGFANASRNKNYKDHNIQCKDSSHPKRCQQISVRIFTSHICWHKDNRHIYVYLMI